MKKHDATVAGDFEEILLNIAFLGGVVSYNDPLVKFSGFLGFRQVLAKMSGRCQGHVGTQHRHMVGFMVAMFSYLDLSQKKLGSSKNLNGARGRGAAWSHAAPPARRRRPGLRPR